MNKQYKIISPNINDKIFEASTMIKGAKRCYDEIKNSHIHANSFTIKDMSSNETFTFAIHPRKQKAIRDLQVGQLGQDGGHIVGGELNVQIKNINDRLDNIEKKVDEFNICSIM